MKKTTKCTKLEDVKPKRVSPGSNTDPEHIYSYRMIPVSAAMVENMIKELKEYPEKNPNAKFITPYYRSKGFAHNDYYRLIAKYPLLKEAHQDALRTIGERLWSNAVDRKADWSPVKHRLYSYAKEFKEDDEHHARLKAIERGDENDKNKGPYIIHLDKLGRVEEKSE